MQQLAHLLLDAQRVDVAVGHRPREEPVRVVAGHEQRQRQRQRQRQAEDGEQDSSGATGIAACHCFSSEGTLASSIRSAGRGEWREQQVRGGWGVGCWMGGRAAR
jgi:hypothetical protein